MPVINSHCTVTTVDTSNVEGANFSSIERIDPREGFYDEVYIRNETLRVQQVKALMQHQRARITAQLSLDLLTPIEERTVPPEPLVLEPPPGKASDIAPPPPPPPKTFRVFGRIIQLLWTIGLWPRGKNDDDG